MKKHVQRKLEQLIDAAYKEWCNRILQNEIPTTNERTLQVYLAYIFLIKAKPFEKGERYNFNIFLEEDAGEQHTTKTNGHARCDIILKITDVKSNKECIAAIEMKCLKKREKDEAIKPTTQKRLSVLQDMENLESYKADLKYEIVYTNYSIYPYPPRNVKNNIGEGVCLNNKHVNDLKKRLGKYRFEWDSCPEKTPEHFFLKLKIR